MLVNIRLITDDGVILKSGFKINFLPLRGDTISIDNDNYYLVSNIIHQIINKNHTVTIVVKKI